LSKVIKPDDAAKLKTMSAYARETLEAEKGLIEGLSPKQLIEQAQEEAEHIREKAYSDGLAAGETEGRERIEKEAASLLDALRAVARQIVEDERQFVASLEPHVVRLAADIARKVLEREVRLDDDAVKQTVTRAVSKLLEREQIVVSVNPSDVDKMREHKAELAQAFDGISKIEVVADSEIEPGGCLVQTDSLLVNGTVDAQIAHIVAELLE